MSVPSSSSKGLGGEKPGGTSPSPVEGVEGVPGPSTIDPLQSDLAHEGESDDYGEEAEEEEDDSTDEESEVLSPSDRSEDTRLVFMYSFITLLYSD